MNNQTVLEKKSFQILITTEYLHIFVKSIKSTLPETPGLTRS